MASVSHVTAHHHHHHHTHTTTTPPPHHHHRVQSYIGSKQPIAPTTSPNNQQPTTTNNQQVSGTRGRGGGVCRVELEDELEEGEGGVQQRNVPQRARLEMRRSEDQNER
jgi:hypothetical protein